ncbi:MAG: hypothetical protein IKC29_03855 [Clostridia bacterium]|nr:hypothetical protein [Clostridia bacterium]
MTDEKLATILKDQINLDDCEEIEPNNLYYIRAKVKQRVYNGDSTYYYSNHEYEFIVIAENGVKKAIILRCGTIDLQWHVLKEWRGKHILSNALRTGIINKVWPDNKEITCCYDIGDDYESKYNMTQHLANIAGLKLVK